MTSTSNDDTHDTLSGLPSHQGGCDQEQEGKGEEGEGKPNDATADAPAKEEEGEGHQRHSNNIHCDRDNNGTNFPKPHRNSNPHKRNINIPPECTYISVSEHDEDEKEYFLRRRSELVNRLKERIRQLEIELATKIEKAKNEPHLRGTVMQDVSKIR